MHPVLTAYRGNNGDLFSKAMTLYGKPGFRILDMTYGLGVFWKIINIEIYDLIKNDIDTKRGDVHEDFRHTSFRNAEFDIVVLDPPYASRSGSPIKASIDRGYNNAKRALNDGIFGADAMIQFYFDGMIEARRILKTGGLLMVKCMDEIMGGKQQRNHITIWNKAIELGMCDEDLFMLVQSSIPTMRHDYQLHARKNNSFLWVFRKMNG